MKIKVCHIITMLELGGAQRNTLYTLKSLNRGLFVPLLISGSGGILDAETADLNGVKTYFLPELVRQISPLKDLLTVFSIFRLLRIEKPGIVHTHSSKAGILGRLAAWLAGVPVIIHTYHGFGFNDFQNFISRSIFILAEKLVNPLTTKFIAVTVEDIAKGTKFGIGSSEKYCLIRSGIDIEEQAQIDYDKSALKKEFGIALDENVVTTIGPFKPQKNLEDFVKTCALIVKELPKTRFLIAGDGEQRQSLERLIKELNLSGIVKLLGWRKDIKKILAITDVFIMTSLWEGLPRSILEAMNMRLPVAANAVDGVKEIIKDGVTGYLIRPRDIKTLSERTVYLLKNPDKAREIGIKARQSIDAQYDINLMVKQQEALYGELMGKYENK